MRQSFFFVFLLYRVAEIGAYIGKRGLVSRSPSHAGGAVKREESEEQRQPLTELTLQGGISISTGTTHTTFLVNATFFMFRLCDI